MKFIAIILLFNPNTIIKHVKWAYLDTLGEFEGDCESLGAFLGEQKFWSRTGCNWSRTLKTAQKLLKLAKSLSQLSCSRFLPSNTL